MTGSLALAICRSSASSPPFRAARPHEQPGRGEEPGRYRAHAREPAQRDREMRLAGVDGPVEYEIELTRHSGLLQFGKTHISTVYTTRSGNTACFPRPARSATRTATPWPRASTARTGPSSSGGASPSGIRGTWNRRRSGGSRGGDSKHLHRSLAYRTPEAVGTEYYANQAVQAAPL